MFIEPYLTLNRTMKELKSILFANGADSSPALNRTMKELKYFFFKVRHLHGYS